MSKSEKGNVLKWQDYQVAFETMWRGIEELDRPVMTQEKSMTTFGDTLFADGGTPEEIAIKKDAFMHLSESTKAILEIILMAPSEIWDSLKTPKYDKISHKKMLKFLSQGGWSPCEIEEGFSELKEFVAEMEKYQ